MPTVEELCLDSVATALSGKIDDPALLALSLQLPSETTLAQEMDIVDPDALFKARELVKRELAQRNAEQFTTLFHDNRQTGAYAITPEAIGRRSLQNVCLSYLMSLDPLPDEIQNLCYEQYRQASNMTDAIAALTNLVDLENTKREDALSDFYKKWHQDPLVLDKWFTLQALSKLDNTLDNVEQLTNNRSFSISNPNKVRSLVGAFCSGNHVRFHDSSGAGYRFLADKIDQLNTINPQIAARLVSPLINWRRYDARRQELMQRELDRILAIKNLSSDVYEIVSKSR